MKCCCLGIGSWGYCLSNLLASKGYEIISWTKNPELAYQLNTSRIHPRFPKHKAPKNILFTTDLSLAIAEADVLIESVTTAGLRTVCIQLKELAPAPRLFVVTSKGIEQKTELILPDVVIDVLGEDFRPYVGFLSGPSYAQEVIKQLPTSVVATAYNPDTIAKVCELFTTPTFRVYPNHDILGVAYGGALKNIIAIACGIADGLQFGFSTKAALMTRGLHEISKLAIAKGARKETLNGLSGMGDMYLTCSSSMSRNFKFGQLLAEGKSSQKALAEIGEVVEGAYTSVTALQLSKELDITMPITEIVYEIIYKHLNIEEAVLRLMKRTIKEEHK